MMVIVPDYIAADINKRLDAAFLVFPDAEKDREALRAQLLAYVGEHGVVPDFTLTKQPTHE